MCVVLAFFLLKNSNESLYFYFKQTKLNTESLVIYENKIWNFISSSRLIKCKCSFILKLIVELQIKQSYLYTKNQIIVDVNLYKKATTEKFDITRKQKNKNLKSMFVFLFDSILVLFFFFLKFNLI